MSGKFDNSQLKKDENFSVVGKANNGDELFSKLESQNPDILIMEIDMPQINGINALRGIKAKFPNLRVLIFSTHIKLKTSSILDSKIFLFRSKSHFSDKIKR